MDSWGSESAPPRRALSGGRRACGARAYSQRSQALENSALGCICTKTGGSMRIHAFAEVQCINLQKIGTRLEENRELKSWFPQNDAPQSPLRTGQSPFWIVVAKVVGHPVVQGSTKTRSNQPFDALEHFAGICYHSGDECQARVSTSCRQALQLHKCRK